MGEHRRAAPTVARVPPPRDRLAPVPRAPPAAAATAPPAAGVQRPYRLRLLLVPEQAGEVEEYA